MKGCKFWSILGTHGHWAVGFFSVSHILWHGASVYNGHLRGPVALTPFAERFAVELSLPVFTTEACRAWDSNTQPSACEENGLTHCATDAVLWNETGFHKTTYSKYTNSKSNDLYERGENSSRSGVTKRGTENGTEWKTEWNGKRNESFEGKQNILNNCLQRKSIRSKTNPWFLIRS